MEHITFEFSLPDNYKKIYCIDAADKRTAILLNLAAAIIMFITGFIGWKWLHPSGFMNNTPLWLHALFLVCLVMYIILHELVHGAAYKLLTHQKLTYGFTFSVAYCGVPHIYVYRKTAIISLLAPFITFLFIFSIGVALMPDVHSKYLVWLLLTLHIAGCSGDLYDTFMYLFKFKDPATLMQDTGPKQTFYLPRDTSSSV